MKRQQLIFIVAGIGGLVLIFLVFNGTEALATIAILVLIIAAVIFKLTSGWPWGPRDDD